MSRDLEYACCSHGRHVALCEACPQARACCMKSLQLAPAPHCSIWLKPFQTYAACQLSLHFMQARSADSMRLGHLGVSGAGESVRMPVKACDQ